MKDLEILAGEIMEVPSMKIDVGVWGSTGLAGAELVGILEQHPHIGNIYKPTHDLENDVAYEGKIDTAFLGLPHSVSARVAQGLNMIGSKIIDLSGALRFAKAGDYEAWYNVSHAAPDLLPVPYGLPEINKAKIAGANIVSMPGCYPTAVLLGLMPILKRGLVVPGSTIIVDAVSGYSGAGRNFTQSDQFETLKGIRPYKVGRIHPHVGEIEQFLDGYQVFFSPSIASFEKGLLAKITLKLSEAVATNELLQIFNNEYSSQPFVEVLSSGVLPEISNVIGKDICQVGVIACSDTVQIISAIDNLRKGAASQAVQAFNLMHEFEITDGLNPKAAL